MEVLSTAGLLEVTPLTEGINHVNIYSKSSTELGRGLSHFSSYGITNHHGQFASLEAYWYWLATGKRFFELAKLTGYAAKKAGRSHPVVPSDNFQQEFLAAIRLRFKQNPKLWSLFKTNELPLTHYYYFGEPDNAKIIHSTKHDWLLVEYKRLIDLTNLGKKK